MKNVQLQHAVSPYYCEFLAYPMWWVLPMVVHRLLCSICLLFICERACFFITEGNVLKTQLYEIKQLALTLLNCRLNVQKHKGQQIV